MSLGYESVHEAATALIRAGTEIFSIGDIEDAQIFFDASHALLIAPSTDHHIMEFAREKLELSRTLKLVPKARTAVSPRFSSNVVCNCQCNDPRGAATGNNTITKSNHHHSMACWDELYKGNATLASPADLYEQGECDVGPRLLNFPVCPARLDNNTISFLQAIVMFNKGLICHSKGQVDLAEGFYTAVSNTATSLLMAYDISPNKTDRITMTELAMRACNNLGVLYYKDHVDLAERAFEASIRFAKQLCGYNPVVYNLEHATVLSNWCRILYMRGEQSNIVYHVQEILRLRRTCLPMEHMDVATAIWNVGANMYYTNQYKNATFYLMQYLGIASRRSLEDGLVELDAIPALVLLLLIQNKDRANQLSQELVGGLCNLAGKRQEDGPSSPEMASILNYIGTILFHQQEYHHALVFFLEELRLEDQKHSESSTSCGSPSVISVTCNNVGRIMQELGRYKEAVFFYERSLKEWYGANYTRQDIAAQIQFSRDKIQQSSNKNAVINLYSTVWYNLGLISDKIGSFDDAMYAFEMALSLRQLMVGNHHADVACLLYNIGVLQMEKNLLEESFISLIRALQIRNVCDAGQLSDEHLVRTLQKLASLLKKEEHLQKALDTYHEITRIQEASKNHNLYLEAGQAWSAIAEIHHARSAIPEAIDAASRGVVCVRRVYDANPQQHAEQMIGALLLEASLFHEHAEPVLAKSIVREALELAQHLRVDTTSSNLTVLMEVTALIFQCQCAPVA